MGSGIEYMDPSMEGILPRAIMHIFRKCNSYEHDVKSKNLNMSKCLVSCQFIEVNHDRINLKNLNFLVYVYE